MARNRKDKTKSPPNTEISEDEQWRLIQESGVLQKVAQSDGAAVETSPDDDGRIPLAEELFSAAVLLIPFSSFLLLMDILIHQQYAKHPTPWEFAERLMNSVPILSVFIFYTSRYKADRRMQVALFILSLGVGPRMIWLINRGSWLVNMRQCPRFATIWLYTVVQLELIPAVVSLAMIGGWAWWADMKLLT
ncbi:hypothetical protein BJ138DRAFT_1076025 [Hygrophoropsis aurantiaca]|uniref:Uncharacterized protein n=1 Tax=Hygrophoropsis aurantiaca TaxID=72124 RepID=A0ACB8ASK4_9AGAM|nr:hypothetical protein BJ138DRAFT_1076025 [Hygrophoropsis aurantiaca]